jgi:hypothetical protein
VPNQSLPHPISYLHPNLSIAGGYAGYIRVQGKEVVSFKKTKGRQEDKIKRNEEMKKKISKRPFRKYSRTIYVAF